MKKYIDLLQANVKNNPQEVFVGICVFFVAVMGTSVHHVASAAFALLLVASLFIIKNWGNTWSQLSKNEKWLLTGFGLYALSGVIAFVNVQDVQEYIKDLERYLRFLAAIPVYLYIKKYNVNVIKYLYAGVVASGPFLLFITLPKFINNPDSPASGDYHHIIFGAVAMLNVGIMLSLLLVGEISKGKKAVIAIAMLCGFVAALLSQSRGVWLALPVYVLIALYVSAKHSKRNFVSIILGLVIVLSVFVFSPVGDMVEKRIDLAVEEVSQYYSDDRYVTSLGTRLAMWEIAIDVWKKHPIIGTGPGDFDEEVRYLQENGKYVGMDLHSTTHNMYFQALVNTGFVGFLLTIIVLYLLPLKMFMRKNTKSLTGSLSGFMFIAFFSIIGLSMSWTMRLPTVSVYILYLLVLVSSLTLTGKNHEQDKV